MRWSYDDAAAYQEAKGVVRGDMVQLGRETRGWPRWKLARKCGLTTARIAAIEGSGGNVLTGRMTKEELQRLAEALQYTPSFFFWNAKIYGPDELFTCTVTDHWPDD